jgi:hypothetical protein
MGCVTTSPGASVPNILGPPSLKPAALVTIRMQEVYRNLSTNYVRILNEIVFSRITDRRENRKVIKSFKRILESSEANVVLSLLWRESPYVTDEELSYDGLSKLCLERPLTTYHLAIYLADDKSEVAATNSRVRLIVSAGTEFGLVAKQQLARTKVLIFGTELLHHFMVRLGFENANSCAQILWRGGEARISQLLLDVPFTASMPLAGH